MTSHQKRFSSWMLSICVFCFVCGIVLTGEQSAMAQALTSEQRKEISLLQRDLKKVSSLLRRKDIEEGEKLLGEVEERLEKLATDAGWKETDRVYQGLNKALNIQQSLLARLQDGPNAEKEEEGVSFAADVAPILSQNCMRCHGNRASGGLSLQTFAGLQRGGQNGPLLTPGNPQRSLIMARLVAPGQARMPRGGQALPQDDIKTIAAWISQGAKFDGLEKQDLNLSLTELTKKVEDSKKPKIEVAKPTGNETVSFKNDIAPFFVALCLNCHQGANPNGGFRMTTFADILRGGDSGEVLVPGDTEASRLYRLVGGLENPRMPQGQARITRQNYNDITAWVKEGIKYDGGDPNTPLRELIPSAAEMAAEKFNAMSAEEFVAHRKEQTEDQWKRTAPRETPVEVETDNFLLVGNVSEARLKEIGTWGEAQAEELKRFFGDKSSRLWKGRLAVFVFKDRYGYDEFNLSVDRRSVPKDVVGHSVVTANQEQAYLALLDVGDVETNGAPAIKFRIAENVTAAYLKKRSANLPDWLVQGTGLALASKKYPSKEYTSKLVRTAASAVSNLRRPDDLFRDGQFAPGEVGPVGLVIVETLLGAGDAAKFGRLIQSFSQGRNANEAFRAAYGIDAGAAATSVLRNF